MKRYTKADCPVEFLWALKYGKVVYVQDGRVVAIVSE